MSPGQSLPQRRISESRTSQWLMLLFFRDTGDQTDSGITVFSPGAQLLSRPRISGSRIGQWRMLLFFRDTGNQTDSGITVFAPGDRASHSPAHRGHVRGGTGRGLMPSLAGFARGQRRRAWRYQKPSSTILPRDRPLSILRCASRRLAAVILPACSARVVRKVPLSISDAISFRISC